VVSFSGPPGGTLFIAADAVLTTTHIYTSISCFLVIEIAVLRLEVCGLIVLVGFLSALTH
jgi:hypothetical protein